MNLNTIDVLLVAPGNHNGLLPFYEGLESLGIGYLTAVLRKSGFNVEILDRHIMNVEIEDFSALVALKSEGKLVGFRGMSGQDLKDMNFILDYFSKNSVKPLHIAVGGIIPSLIPYEVLRNYPDVDSVICYEGELSFLELAMRLQAKRSIERIPGRAYRKENGEIVLSSPSPYVRDLDSLPYPARDTLTDVMKLNSPALIQGSRGCYGQCTFCIQHYLNRKLTGGIWRGRCPENIVSEIKELICKYNIKRYGFVDENFFCNNENGHKRAMEFAACLKREGISIPFKLSARTNDIDEKMLNELSEVGLKCVTIGIEAGTQKILDRYNKMTDLKTNIEALRLIKKTGLSLNMGFIMFNPESTLDEIHETILFLRDEVVGTFLSLGGIAYCLKNTIQIYLGSPLFNHYARTGLVKMIRDDSDPYLFSYRFRDNKISLFISILERILHPLEKIFIDLESLKKTKNTPFLKKMLANIDEISIDMALQILEHIRNNNPDDIELFIIDLECRVFKKTEDILALINQEF